LNLNIIDTHAHLDMPEFDPDRDEVIKRAQDSGVTTIITIGIDLKSSREAIKLAEKHAGVFASVGIHPQESKNALKKDIDKLVEMTNHPRVVAIGELGLDFYRNFSPREAQFLVLQWELEIAKQTGLPIIVHCRQAQNEMPAILSRWGESYPLPEGKARGVIHCFNGNLKTAELYLKMGFYISLGAYIGYPSASELRNTLKDIALDKIVIETDCPFLPPQKYRGQRNEPCNTLITLGVLADIQGVTLEKAALQTTQNAQKVFKLPVS
jgi:TatD DNase family protein